MPTQLRLTVRDRQRRTQEIVVDAPRFTIGSGADNDLELHDPAIAEWHAVIECFGVAPRVTDYGATGGTRLNGHVIAGTASLADGDVVSLGGAYELIVHLDGGGAPPLISTSPALKRDATGLNETRPATAVELKAVGAVPPTRLGVPALAIAGVIALVGCLAIYLLTMKTEDEERTEPPGWLSTPTPAPSASRAITDEDVIEDKAKTVLRCISTDQAYVFQQQPLDDVVRAVARFKQDRETTARALQEVAARRDKIRQIVPDNSPTPQLLLLATAAELATGHSTGDPVLIAGALLPRLKNNLTEVGQDARSTLIAIAGLRLNVAELQRAMRKLEAQPNLDAMVGRDLWEMRKQNHIGPEAYHFAIEFLALAAIAQDPPRFGVQARALGCAP